MIVRVGFEYVVIFFLFPMDPEGTTNDGHRGHAFSLTPRTRIPEYEFQSFAPWAGSQSLREPLASGILSFQASGLQASGFKSFKSHAVN